MNWFSKNWTLLLALGIGVFLTRSLFPRTVHDGRVIPQIVTKYDTVRVPWKYDTIYRYKHTTDTFNLVTHETLYDTVVINVHDSTIKLWPLLSYIQKSRDSAYARTFNLVSGKGAIAQYYTPGPLKAIYADTNATPIMDFGAWPVNKTSLFTKIIYTGLGYGVCTLTNKLN